MTIPHDVIRRSMFTILSGDARTQRVLATDPLAYWRLAEGSGLAIVDSAPGGLYPGTYTGITWDGTKSPYNKPTPFYDGTNDYGNVYSAAFASAFNMDEGCILLFLKVANAGVWTDGAFRRFITIQRNVNNRFLIQKNDTSNTVQFQRIGNAVAKSIIVGGFNATGFLSLMMSYSIAADALIAYQNGVQIGATQTGNLAAVGSGLSSTEAVLGAAITTPTTVWNGYLAEVVVWTKPADAAMIALGVPPA